MRICIATGIYPPATSGPAQYAAAMEREFAARGHEVSVATFGIEHSLPTGLRHLWYFLRVLPQIMRADAVLALDTFSVGLPATCAARLFHKKIVLRTGGDFLYEQFTERTQLPVMLSKFYATKDRWSMKERIIFALTKWTVRNVSQLVFSTAWQRDIWMEPYALQGQTISIIENRFDEKISDEPAQKKNFIFATRKLAYKNIDRFVAAFEQVKQAYPEIELELHHTTPHDELIEKMKTCYAVAMPSLGEISPHVILDALRCNKPFIMTRESGFAEQLRDVGLLIDPLSVDDMAEKISMLATDEVYTHVQSQVRAYKHTHSWGQIADELLAIFSVL